MAHLWDGTDPFIAKRLETRFRPCPDISSNILNPHPRTPNIHLDTLLLQLLIKPSSRFFGREGPFRESTLKKSMLDIPIQDRFRSGSRGFYHLLQDWFSSAGHGVGYRCHCQHEVWVVD